MDSDLLTGIKMINAAVGTTVHLLSRPKRLNQYSDNYTQIQTQIISKTRAFLERPPLRYLFKTHLYVKVGEIRPNCQLDLGWPQALSPNQIIYFVLLLSNVNLRLGQSPYPCHSAGQNWKGKLFNRSFFHSLFRLGIRATYKRLDLTVI